VVEWLKSYNIHIKYVNENPLEKDTEYASFVKKPYFSIVLDDKAGFDPNHDWNELWIWCDKHRHDKFKKGDVVRLTSYHSDRNPTVIAVAGPESSILLDSRGGFYRWNNYDIEHVDSN
jgi:hypothetical protein